MKLGATIPEYATEATHAAAQAADHAADLKDRGHEDAGQSQIAVAFAGVAIAAELAELRNQLRNGTLYVERVVT